MADPPYGKREKKDTNASEPLFDIVNTCVTLPLLKKNGRLVVFVPVETEHLDTRSSMEVLESLCVTKPLLVSAKLQLRELLSQRLNAHLSRLLLVFEHVST